MITTIYTRMLYYWSNKESVREWKLRFTPLSLLCYVLGVSYCFSLLFPVPSYSSPLKLFPFCSLFSFSIFFFFFFVLLLLVLLLLLLILLLLLLLSVEHHIVVWNGELKYQCMFAIMVCLLNKQALTNRLITVGNKRTMYETRLLRSMDR